MGIKLRPAALVGCSGRTEEGASVGFVAFELCEAGETVSVEAGRDWSRPMAGELRRREILATTSARIPDFLGLTEPEARGLADQLGLVLRVTRPGGFGDKSLRPNRMTVVLEEGIVVRASAG